ncbi:MAG: ComF family protein [Bacteroidales bacterium]|nr:ComF family protein [Bacteroidales bacterium]
MKILQIIKRAFCDLFDIIYPEYCPGCGNLLSDYEKVVCLDCMSKMKITHTHLPENTEVKEVFMNKVEIQNACAYYGFFKGGITQRLIHDFKYHNRPDIAVFLGKNAAYSLNKSGIFSDVDFIVPVPLHPNKFKKRGYNQSERIAYGISQVLNIPINEDVLKKVVYNETQTKKKRMERWVNSQNLFKASDNPEFQGKHYLIVDDVLTTGSTIESCVNEIQKIPNIKVSVFALARAEK